MNEPARAWAEVDLGAIAHNVGVLRRVAAPAGILAVVKADGYGHGAAPVAAAALDAGAARLGVAITDEGVALRDAGIAAPVVVLSEPRPAEFHDCVVHRLEPAVYTAEGVAAAAKASLEHGAADRHGPLAVHLKIDTGMHRVGAAPGDAVALADAIGAERSLALASAWTHLAIADEPDDPYTAEQLARFDAVHDALVERGHRPALRHAANSAGALCHPAARYDLVRCGIAVYGIAPAAGLDAVDGVGELRPALALAASVSLVKVVAAGERISYGLRHRFDVDSVVATVPIGYADGVRRDAFALGAHVLIGGRRRPVVGTVTMDQLMVDCGPAAGRTEADGPVPAPGDEAVLIGEQDGVRITAEEWARWLGTIGYEVVCGIGPRVPRRYAAP